jgi:hypothetical protein
MKVVMRIALLLIAIVGLTVGSFTDIGTTRAFTSCNAPVWQNPPSGYEFVSIIVCDDAKYELWQNPGTGLYIRRPSN